jgi:tRNA (mo5U34)-methyltransferase
MTLAERVAKIKWWHQIDLGDGIITPGAVNSFPKLAYSKLPEDMTGMRVLDIGAWDGWWSFLCEKRGATEVVALDRWNFDTGSEGFQLASEVLQSQVNWVRASVDDITPRVLGQFDLVLCLGVLHHLQSPLRALTHIADVCRGKLILETHLDVVAADSPLTAFYSQPPYPYDDPTILWGPNEACVRSWLKVTGFSDVELVGRDEKGWKGGGDRATFHANKLGKV